MFRSIRALLVCSVLLVPTRAATAASTPDEGYTPLSFAIIAGQKERASLLIERGADPNGRRDETCPPPLFCAVRMGFGDLASHLVEKGANLEAMFKGSTLLSAALSVKDHRAARLLVERGANVNPPTLLGMTPLVLSLDMRFPNLARLLLEKGAAPNVQDMFGMSPLHIAAAKGDASIAALLLKYRANTMLENEKGVTPVDMARMGGHSFVVDLLTSRNAKHIASLTGCAKYLGQNVALSVTNSATAGMVYGGDAGKPGHVKRWPFLLRITDIGFAPRQFKGWMEWTTMGSKHVIEGTIGKNALTFTETTPIKRGVAYLGTRHTFSFSPSANFYPTRLVGTWAKGAEGGDTVLDFTVKKNEGVNEALLKRLKKRRKGR